jgi:hypothetical protein
MPKTPTSPAATTGESTSTPPTAGEEAGRNRATSPVSDAAAGDGDDVAASWSAIAGLRPWARNPRHNDGEPVRKVADSIKHFGWAAPVIAQRNGGEVVAGHTRLKAVDVLIAEWALASDRQRATWHPDAVRCVTRKQVPVRFGDWSERDAHLLAIADNKLNELAEWDTNAVAEILSDYGIRDALLSGFTLKDLDAMAEEIASGGEGGGDGEDAGPSLGGLEYRVVIECESEEQQLELLGRFDGEGLKCKALIS